MGNTFLPYRTAVGTYRLTYTYTNATGCVSTGTLTANVLSCPERIQQLGNGGVILYPNPNNGHFNLKLNSTLYNYLGLKVYTSSGSLIRVKAFTGLQYGRVIPIDLGDLPAGVYQVQVYYDDGAQTAFSTFKIVISQH
ncbi:MAG TPA: T9SS type A sorting domain-containing protein [Chitinophagaceae bacterium]|nr:T9SS type A sorting domain-containing protein [Chitinophagaceae bacterium]